MELTIMSLISIFFLRVEWGNKELYSKLCHLERIISRTVKIIKTKILDMLR